MPHRTKKTPRYFEDLKVGEVWEAPSRTHTESLFYAFQLVSGDNRPLHYDVEYCKSLGLPGLLAHGYQVLAQTALVHRTCRGAIRKSVSSACSRPVRSS